MPDDEGLALYDGRRRRGAPRPVARDRHVLRQVGGLPRCGGARARHACCSRSTITAARRRTKPGGSTTTPRSSIPETGRMDTLPFFRRTIAGAGLEDVVVAVVGHSVPVAARLADAARVGVHRRRPRARRRHGRLRRLGTARAARWPARVPRRVRRPGRRRAGAVRGVQARGCRRLHARDDHRLAPRPAAARVRSGSVRRVRRGWPRRLVGSAPSPCRPTTDESALS